MNHVTLSSEVPRDPPPTKAVPFAASAATGRLFFFAALFFLAEVLLALSTYVARRWQWSALLLLCVLGLICSVMIARRRGALAVTANRVLLCVVLTRLPALFALPLFDDDYFRFLWDGQQLLSGLSPYATAPAAYFSHSLADPVWEAVLSGINHPDVPTIYGPSLQALFTVATFFGGASPLPLKAIFVGADVLLVALLLRAGAAPWLTLLYVLNPLAIKEIGFSLHPDGLIALGLTLATLALHRQQRLLAAACVALVACAKLPLLLLGAALNVESRLHRQVMLGGALIALCAYLPFLFPDPAQPFVGLRAFADGWRYNALGFHLFEWFAGAQARLWLAAFYATCALAVTYSVARSGLGSATAMLLMLALLLLTAPTVNPWYWLMVLPLAIVAFHQDRVLLVTPWIGSFALLLGYATGLSAVELGLSPDGNAVSAEFSVLPVATIAQASIMACAGAYDFFKNVSGRSRLSRHRVHSSRTSS